jgi:hypothetical protein
LTSFAHSVSTIINLLFRLTSTFIFKDELLHNEQSMALSETDFETPMNYSMTEIEFDAILSNTDVSAKEKFVMRRNYWKIQRGLEQQQQQQHLPSNQNDWHQDWNIDIAENRPEYPKGVAIYGMEFNTDQTDLTNLTEHTSAFSNFEHMNRKERRMYLQVS